MSISKTERLGLKVQGGDGNPRIQRARVGAPERGRGDISTGAGKADNEMHCDSSSRCVFVVRKQEHGNYTTIRKNP